MATQSAHRNEQEAWVAYATLRPAARLARAFGVPLKTLGRWMELAYFQELRDAGFTLEHVAERVGVSLRKAAMLSKDLKQNFLAPHRDRELPRRIAFMLWAHPTSRARILQALPDEDPKDVEAALDKLVAEGRVVERPGRVPTYEVKQTRMIMVEEDWLARIDGLQHLLDTVTHTIYARFFQNDARAFARTLTFRVREQDREKLQALYDETIFPTLAALDQAADDDPEAEPVDLAIAWAPYRYMTGDGGSGSGNSGAGGNGGGPG